MPLKLLDTRVSFNRWGDYATIKPSDHFTAMLSLPSMSQLKRWRLSVPADESRYALEEREEEDWKEVCRAREIEPRGDERFFTGEYSVCSLKLTPSLVELFIHPQISFETNDGELSPRKTELGGSALTLFPLRRENNDDTLLLLFMMGRRVPTFAFLACMQSLLYFNARAGREPSECE